MKSGEHKEVGARRSRLTQFDDDVERQEVRNNPRRHLVQRFPGAFDLDFRASVLPLCDLTHYVCLNASLLSEDCV